MHRPGTRTAMRSANGQDVNVAKRLLIVDDDARFRGLARMVLEAEFDVVGEAGEGVSALAAVRELDPDVVLLDVNLPDTTGFELAPRLISDANRPEVVMTSSRDDASYEQLAQDAGAAAFLSKH